MENLINYVGCEAILDVKAVVRCYTSKQTGEKVYYLSYVYYDKDMDLEIELTTKETAFKKILNRSAINIIENENKD